MLWRWFIYVLRDPRNNEVRYIGKTINPTKRLWDHLRTSRLRRHPSGRWIDDLLAIGLRPTQEIVDVGTSDGDYGSERAWIAEYRRRGANLTNVAAGGNGTFGPCTEERREKLRAAQAGRTHSLATKEKMAAAHRGIACTAVAREKNRVSNTGVKRSAETCEKNRLAHVGRKASPETKAKMSASHMGRIFSPETREKIAASKRGKPRSAETVRKVSASLTGKKLSAEHRAKLSEAHRARWAKKKENHGQAIIQPVGTD